MEKIRILLIDDHQLITDVWSTLLNSDERFEIIGTAGDSDRAYELVEQLHPDIVLCDINIKPDDGTLITARVGELSPGTKVIGVSLHSHLAYVKKMLSEGAKGYVTKNSSVEELKEAITEVHAGRNYLCREVETFVFDSYMGKVPGDDPGLSARELEIVRAVVDGMTSKEIALKLGLSPKTVEVHRYHIMKKLDLKNVAELVRYANERGI